VDATRGELCLFHKGVSESISFPLPPGCLARRIARGPGGFPWLTTKGSTELVRLTRSGSDTRFRAIKGLAEGKADLEPAAPAPRPPMDILDSLDLFLSDRTVAHILERHSYNLDTTNGQFNPEFSKPEALAALLARGAQEAGTIGSVVKRYDPWGIRHTPCHMAKPIGYRYSPALDEWLPTRSFDLVTRDVALADGTRVQVVLSAYPISADKF
jgi:hypothetical protein